ncbi:MAG: hypothetical protein U0359_14325 [Byssovorax sp.]
MPHRTASLTHPLLLLAALTSCSSSSDKALHLDITTGQETDTFSMDPPVTRITISAKSPDGSTAIIATTTPGGTFDLGDVVETESVGFEVAGYDAFGHLVARGRSLGAISLVTVGTDSTVPVFVQRIGQWARPNGGLTRAHVNGPAGALGEQYVWQTGGKAYDMSGEVDAKDSDFYDFFGLRGATGPTLDRAPKTLVSLGSAAFVFDDEGGTSLDFAGQTKADLIVPKGIDSFAEIAGGIPVFGDDGTTFVVGATRTTGEATKSVLIVASDGTLTATSLHTARLGAAAAFVASLGLMVAGGSSEGAGVELLPSQTTTFVAADYPADAVTGAAAVIDPRDSMKLKMLLVGGSDGGKPAATRVVDMGCSKACAAVEIPGMALPVTFDHGAGYVLNDTQVIVVGDEVSQDGPGQTRPFVLDLGAMSVTETPLREPRKGASPIPTPLGTLAILGGQHLDGSPAFSVESYFPP